MPVYNREKILQVTLDSIACQSYTNWELLIIDDGSTDGSMNLIKIFCLRYPNKVNILSSIIPRSGPSVCRNIGINACSGEYVIFLDSDDLLSPFCLDQRLSILIKNKHINWAIFNQYNWNPELSISDSLFNKHISSVSDAISYFVMMQPPWQVTSPIWKTSFLKELGGFDESLFYMEDPDLHLRALLKKNRPLLFCFDNPPDSYYRIDSFDSEKENVFYSYSILSRIKYIEKFIISNSDFYYDIIPFLADFKKGFILFLKQFVLARIDMYNTSILDLTIQLKQKKIISNFDYFRIRFIFFIFLKNYKFLNLFRIKGILYRFFV